MARTPQGRWSSSLPPPAERPTPSLLQFPLQTRPSPRQRELRQTAAGNLLVYEGPAVNRKELERALQLHGVCEMTGNMLLGGMFTAVPGRLPLTVRTARALAKSWRCHARFRFQIPVRHSCESFVC